MALVNNFIVELTTLLFS